MANYYDRVLEDFDISRESEGAYDDSYDGESFDGESYDGESYDEARSSRRRPIRMPASVGRPANFGRAVNATSQGNLVTKADLRNSLNSISNQVNDLKKSNISLAGSIKGLNDSYENVVKSIAKKDRAQDSMMSNSTMMAMMGALINKPKLDTNALAIRESQGTDSDKRTLTIVPIEGKDPIVVDLTKTLLFIMMPSMMSGNGGENNSMMMMPMMLLMMGNNSGGSTGSGTDNTMMMVMMMNKK